MMPETVMRMAMLVVARMVSLKTDGLTKPASPRSQINDAGGRPPAGRMDGIIENLHNGPYKP